MTQLSEMFPAFTHGLNHCFRIAAAAEKTMNRSENLFFTGSSLASQVHAAAINGDKGALHRLIIGK